MAIQIANLGVIEKSERLSTLTGLSKTAAVEIAVDRLLAEGTAAVGLEVQARYGALLAQMDRIAERPDAFDPLLWDGHGLPA